MEKFDICITGSNAFLIDNVSNLTSAGKIAETLTGQKDRINHKTVGSYLEYRGA